jgi:hypothetical protein
MPLGALKAASVDALIEVAVVVGHSASQSVHRLLPLHTGTPRGMLRAGPALPKQMGQALDLRQRLRSADPISLGPDSFGRGQAQVR